MKTQQINTKSGIAFRFSCVLFLLITSSVYADQSGSLLGSEFDSDTWAHIEVLFSENHVPAGLEVTDGGIVCILANHHLSDRVNICYAEYDDMQWDYEVLSTDTIRGLDLALTTDSRPVILAYSYNSQTMDLYERQGDLTWTVETIATLEGMEYITNASLALDSQDYPHIAAHVANAWELRYYNYNGVSWMMKNDFGNGQFPKIALDNQDNPRISYKIYDLMLSVFAIDQWWTQVIRTGGSNGAILVDDNDMSHICSTPSLYHLWDAGSGWGSALIDDSWISGPDMTMGSDGTLYIAYIENENEDLRFAFGTGSVWSYDVIDWEGIIGGPIKIAVDNEDNRYIIYTSDYYDLNLMIYQNWVGSEDEYSSAEVNSLLNLNISPSPASDFFTVSYQYPDDSEACLEIFDGCGRLVRTHSLSENGNSTFEVGNLPTGVYSVVLKSEDLMTSKRITVIN